MVSQRVACDPSVTVKGIVSFSPKRLDQVERPHAVLKRTARVDACLEHQVQEDRINSFQRVL
jgi:hypothetical protein